MTTYKNRLLVAFRTLMYLCEPVVNILSRLLLCPQKATLYFYLEATRLINKKIILLLLFVFSAQIYGYAMNSSKEVKDTLKIYLSPTGNDSSAGTTNKPVLTIEKAHQLASSYYKKKVIQFIFKDGVYYLPSTINVAASQSGSRDFPVFYKAENIGQAIISGGTLLNLKWEKWKNGIFRAKNNQPNVHLDQLYVNGKRQPMARYPNIVLNKNVFDCWDLSNNHAVDSITDFIYSHRAKRWKNPKGAYVHAMHSALWGDMHWIVLKKDKNDQLVMQGGWQNNRPSPMHPVFRMIENVFEELDQPGEWYYDNQDQVIYYYPLKGQNLSKATVEAVRLKHLVVLSGTQSAPVKDVHWEGFVFKHSARTFMENKEPLLRSDWTIYRGGSFNLRGTEHCSVRECEFDQVGGNAIMVDSYNRYVSIYGCNIHESGANGIAFVGDPSEVKSPLFRYGPQNYDNIDMTPGTRGENHPAYCDVQQCLITQTGRVEKQTSPIEISMSYRIRISHCSIFDVPRAGINISEGTYGGHIIEDCDVFNTVLETSDHGSFNSWGRDRFWTNDCKTTSQQVSKNPNLPYLDMCSPTIIRHNRWRCDHGWDIDLDDGSSFYRIYDNILLNGGLKLREGFDRIATNNIIINNSVHLHVWYANSNDIISQNILFDAYKPIGMNVCMSASDKWGKIIDSNFYISDDNSRLYYKRHGCDLNSISGDPKFKDEQNGDYTVNESSQALQVGFRNFDMHNFGVTLARLKKISKSPVFPEVLKQKKIRTIKKKQWLGAFLKDITTIAEMSAVGWKEQSGVLITDLAVHSTLYKQGLRANDLIISLNKTPVTRVFSFLDSIHQESEQSVVLKVWRNQQEMSLKINLNQ